MSNKSLKIGFVVECGPKGIDQVILDHFAKCIAQEHSLAISTTFRTLGRKDTVIATGAAVARALLEVDKCDRVYIVWDLEPSWTQSKPCRKVDRDTLLNHLDTEGLDPANGQVKLLCVEKEIEVWLLVDGDALSAAMSKPTRPVRVKHEKRPDSIGNPKGTIDKLYKNNKCQYDEFVSPHKILKENPSLKLLQKSSSFKRFYDSLV